MIADSRDKYATSKLISANITLTKPNKALTAQFLTQTTTVAKLFQHGIRAIGKPNKKNGSEEEEIQAKLYLRR